MSQLQMPLALKPPRRPTFGNFVVGENAPVLAMLKNGLEDGGWYFLAGPAGSGRTHLLSAVLGARSEAGQSALFIALRDPGQWALLDQARAEWILVDDIDCLAGQRDGEMRLFNALNRWRAERSGVILTGRGREGFDLPDLRSRLGQATRLTLSPMEERDLAEMIVRLAAEREVPLGRGVVDYLLSRTRRNAGCLARLVESLTDRALSERRTLSIPLVRDTLAVSSRDSSQ